MAVDYTAQFPYPILEYYHDNPEEKDDPKQVIVEEGFVAEIKGKQYFIHARATLPLHDLDNGVGFGLWIEVGKDVYDNYCKSIDIDEEYKKFSAIGTLAQDWPGFLDTYGLKVKIRTVRVDEKVYVTEIMSKPVDIALEASIHLQTTDAQTIQKLRTMVEAYYKDLQG